MPPRSPSGSLPRSCTQCQGRRSLLFQPGLKTAYAAPRHASRECAWRAAHRDDFLNRLPRIPTKFRGHHFVWSTLDKGRAAVYTEERQGNAGVTQLVECRLPKPVVAGSNPVSRSDGPGAHKVPGFCAQISPVPSTELADHCGQPTPPEPLLSVSIH